MKNTWSKTKHHFQVTLQWHHNGYLKSPASQLFTQQFLQVQIKKTSKLRVTGLCAGNSPVTGEFPTQRASNAENISIWWRHHECVLEKSGWPCSEGARQPLSLSHAGNPGHYNGTGQQGIIHGAPRDTISRVAFDTFILRQEIYATYCWVFLPHDDIRGMTQ